MASTSTHLGFATEPSSHDDKMEMATSPYHHQDDINLDDFDAMQDHSVDNSMLGDADSPTNDMDTMQDEQQGHYQDDDMLDEDYTTQPDQQTTEFNMDEQVGNPAEDDEILYEEDAPIFADAPVTTDPNTPTDDRNYPEEPVEIVEDMFEDMEKTEQRPHTNTDAPTSQYTDTEDHTEDKVGANQPPVPSTDDNARDDFTSIDVVDFAEPNIKEQALHSVTHEVISGDIGPEQQSIKTRQSATEEEAEIEHHSINTDEDENSQILAEPEELTEEADTAASQGQGDVVFHPVKIVYLEEEMSLFPPIEGDLATTFFLQDSELVSQPIDKLLAACREVLGDSLGHEDELVLDVPTLGLHICEDSRHAAQLSLAQILEVYIMLSNNDSQTSIEPLYCTLSSRVCLATQYAYLVEAAREGKTYSEIIADYVDTPEPEAEPFSHTESHDEEPSAGASEEASTEVEARATAGTELEDKVDKNERPAPSPLDTEEPVSGIIDADHAQEIHEDEVEEPTASGIPAIRYDIDGTDHHEDLEPSYDDPTNIDVKDFQEESEQLHVDEQDDEKGAEAPVVQQVSSEIPDEETVLEGDAVPYDETGVDSETDGGVINEDELNFIDDVPYENQDVEPPTLSNGQASDATHPNENGSTNGVAASQFILDPDAETSFLDDQDVGDHERDKDTATFPESEPLSVELHTNPLTPSKQSNSKRKALEEQDDLDFIELSTPEPKRTRSS